jgi:predicted DNA-binding transcriptional regulator AlpA
MSQATGGGPLTTRKPWELVGVSRTYWYRLMGSGRAPAPVSFGGARYWRVADLEAWLAGLKPVQAICPRKKAVPA